MMRIAILTALLFLLARAPAAEAPITPEGFALPQPGRRFVFPRDHGSHPEFKIEWWYVTGHLAAEDGRRFGYQVTFFRRAADRPGGVQIYLAHMALLDVKTGRFLHQERLNREGWDAGASATTLDVRCGPWSLRLTQPDVLQLAGSVRGEALFEFELRPVQPLVVFGKDGVSRKGAEAGAASHYLTFPRLATRGTLTLAGEKLRVQGESWMDHEMSSSQLGAGQVGWDWACLQLRDGRSVMVYRMRRADGTADPFSTLAWVQPDGTVRHAGAGDFTLTPLAKWRSPQSGAEYPSGMELGALDPATGQRVRWRIVPLARDQELTGRITGLAYWEGACRVLDEQGAEIGSAFLELTGYAGDLRRDLR